jgi:hypothetical protein
MTKGLVGSLLRLFSAVLDDIAERRPDLRDGFRQDLCRLEALSVNHGSNVFTLFMPALGKVFDRSLETGVLSTGGIPLTRTINRRTSIPRLFQGMWRLFFTDNGCLKQDIDPTDVRDMRTLCFIFKKYRLDCAPKATMKAVKEYYDVDLALPPSSPEWDGLGDNLASMHSRSLLDRLAFSAGLFGRGSKPDYEDAKLLSIAQSLGDRVSSMLGEYLPQHSRFRHGPGAVSDLQTGRAYKYAFPTWSRRLRHVFPHELFGESNLRNAGITGSYEETQEPDLFGDYPLGSEELRHPNPWEWASYLYAVPKTQKGPRLIAAEPTCHQWCQQSVRSFLAVSIAKSVIGQSIDFRRQDLSGDRAMLASLTRESATVDLSSASDRLSTWLVERMFRANSSLLSAFIACRSRFIVNDIDKKSPKLYKLRKFASMGSALTFPVQSLVFYMLCVAAGVYTLNCDPSRWSKIAPQVRVYGDDLIVPVEWMDALRRLLSLLYLQINEAKTFSDGFFRESCGTDAFRGENVSPGQIMEVFSKSNIGTLQGVVDCSNNLFLKGYRNASNALLSPVPAGIRKYIPWVSPGSNSFGLVTGSGFDTTARKRWNVDLHRWEFETFRFRPKRDTRAPRHEGLANLLQYFTEDPSTTELAQWASGLFTKPTTVVSRGWEAQPLR